MKRWPPARRLLLLAAALALAACERAPDAIFQGWVEADQIFVSPDDPGRIESLAVREGDAVKTGGPLFAVDDELQRADVQASKAAVLEAQARLARAQAQQQRPAEIAVLEAQEEKAEAALALSTAELARQRQLAEKNIASKAQLDAAEANFRRDQAALEEIRRQITVARMSAREEDIEAAREAFAAAEARLRAAQTRLARRRVASPVDGVVQRIYFRAGEMVPSGRAVAAILPPGNVKVRFFVPQPQLPGLAIGERVIVRCDGCADGIAARVSFISPTAEYTPPVVYTLDERAKLVFLVEARPQEPERLRVGQPVRVSLVRGGTR